MEYASVPAYAGTNPAAVNPVFTRLIAGLAAPGSLVLRIGGDSSDRTWWPVKGSGARPA